MQFVAADITNEQQFVAALDAADEVGPLRAGAPRRGRGADPVVEKEGQPGRWSRWRRSTSLT
ncbi:hypothetical protein ACWDKQ_19800 [Saccharopolyspora sp. NPDC000995]